MSDALRLGWSEGEAASRAGQHRAALGAYLALHVLAGLALVLTPGAFRLPLPEHGLARVLGGLLIVTAVLQLPSWQSPVRSRVTALGATLGRFLLAFLWLVAGGRLVWVGLFETACAIGLTILLARFFTAELMSRP